MDLAARARSVSRGTGQLINTSLARGAGRYPSAAMARDGFVVAPDYLTAAQADAALADVVRFTDRSVTRTGVQGAGLRDRANKQTRDLNVRALMGADRLSPTLEALRGSGRIEATMREFTGLDLRVGGLTVQIDWPDTETKRGLHVDSHWPPTYKTFVYLTDVPDPHHGPFSVVPGSHRHRLKKLRAIAGDSLRGRDVTDLDATYSMSAARCLLGAPGTAIFADQRLAHAGWPGHTVGVRVMLVAYLYSSDVTPPGFL